MGQDNSCGVCGKHYQTCRHYVKEHIASYEGLALCGSGGDYVDLSADVDPDDICERCKKSLLALGKKDFGQFLYVIQGNQ